MTGRRRDDFADYVAARRGYLRRVAYLMCGNWHSAEDLVQTALMKLYVAWPRIRRQGTEDAYARRIVLRAYLDEQRRPWRRESIGLDGIDVAPDSPTSPEDEDELRAALRTLPERQRATVVLRFWCGLSVEETAYDMGCSPGTVKSNTARALGTLRAKLSDSQPNNNGALR